MSGGRRIRVWGSATTEDFGGHTLVQSSGQARISGVELDTMGQKNVMARYPLHFHVLGEAPQSYIEDCSIQNSYFRAITIHATNSSRFSRNVAYNIKGMAVRAGNLRSTCSYSYFFAHS